MADYAGLCTLVHPCAGKKGRGPRRVLEKRGTSPRPPAPRFGATRISRINDKEVRSVFSGSILVAPERIARRRTWLKNYGKLRQITVNYGKLRQITVNYGSFVAAQASLRAWAARLRPRGHGLQESHGHKMRGGTRRR